MPVKYWARITFKTTKLILLDLLLQEVLMQKWSRRVFDLIMLDSKFTIYKKLRITAFKARP